MPAADIDAVGRALAANLWLTSAPHQESGPIVDVVVPIYDAPDELAACLASVARHTDLPFRLALINDGSSSPEISQMLGRLREAAPRLLVVDRRENRGFVETVNEGFSLSRTCDVVVLNSDTIVTRGWLGKLMAVARSRRDVATVTPLTNNGTICSVPSPLEANAIPEGYDVDSLAALVETLSLRAYPEAPTGVGFCMLVTRRALDAVGSFDARTFGAGYGEENDFCQRAIRAGLVNLIADDTFVYHKGHASFGVRASELLPANLARVAARHPAYAADVERFCRDHPLRAFHERLGDHLASHDSQQAIDLRVLHLLHRGGGTEKHARELAAIDDRRVLSYVLLSDGRHLDVDEYHRGERRRSFRFPLPVEIGRRGPLRDAAYRDLLATICWTLAVDVIHVHHLMHHTLDIAEVATARGIPYMMTLHDYHVLCPSYTLLDEQGQMCGACVKATAPDLCCTAALPAGVRSLACYQELMRGFLQGAARVFAPNPRVVDVLAARFPELAPAVTVVEHGCRASGVASASAPPGLDARRRSDGLNVAVLGGLDVHKGLDVFREVLRTNRRDETTFHLYGTAPDPELVRPPLDEVRRVGNSRYVYHGPYDSGTIAERLRADGIDVGLQLAVWPETFSYVVSELADARIPIVCGELGAQGERVARCRLGWTLPDIRKPNGVLAVLDEILDTPNRLSDVTRQMRTAEALRPLEAMWRDYEDAYRNVARPRGDRETGDGEAPPTVSREQIQRLAASLASATARAEEQRRPLQGLAQELDAVRERMRSPRHRVAEVLGNGLQRIPLVWPVVSSLTEAFLRWERKREHRR